MKEEDIVKPVNENHEPQARSRYRFLTGLLAGSLLGTLLGGSLSLYSHANRGSEWSHSGEGFWGHHGYGFSDPEATRERVEFATDWILKRINASEGQRQRVQSIVKNAVNDLSQVKEQHRQNRQTLLDALSQPTINRGALQETRRAELQLVDTGSSRLLEAMADVAEVLTAEQRAKLIELISRFHH